MRMAFPKDFIWGAATSAYQIEGAAHDDGRGPSIWDLFSRKAGAVWQGASGDVACDHYHRYREDISLMKGLGLQAYRFSISWPRVLPQGTGPVNKQGLDFYDRLVDRLLSAGITPYVTLFHWDYPQALHEQGGWLSRDSSDWFAEYAAVVVSRLSDRVQNWFTVNEPQIFVGCGYQNGSHAPGERLDFPQVLAIAHNVLLAHGKAVQTIRSRARVKPCVGYALSVNPVAVPATDSADDIQAAGQAFFANTKQSCMNNSWWTDPVVFGRYPEDGLKLFENALPLVGDSDMKTISQPLDFLGLNVYFGELYCAGANGAPMVVPFAPGLARTSFSWPIVPESLYWAAKFYYERYALPIIIAENGMSNRDSLSSDNAVHDPQRIDFLHRYLRELKRTCADAIDVRGYFLWSFMDNFEWAAGYRERFGIVYVDYPTQKRILKDSALWYREVITANGANI
jgi:beta-glucosidase